MSIKTNQYHNFQFRLIFPFSNIGKSLSVIALLCLALSAAFAQPPSERYQNEDISQQQFDEAKWQEIISEIDYSKDLAPEQKEEPEESEETDDEAQPFNWRSPIQFGEGFGKTLSIALLSILGIVALLILLRFLLVPPKNRKIENTENLAVSVEEIAENLEAHDPRSLLEKATDAGNFRLAMRLYYLKIIRELSLKKQIKWQRDKTNHSYLQEMNGHALQKEFREMTLLFERVWYGNRELSAADFEGIRPKAEDLLAKIAAIEELKR